MPSGPTHLLDHAVREVPDLIVADLDHRPSCSSEPLEPLPIPTLIGQAGMEDRALHLHDHLRDLHDHLRASVDVVDPPDPPIGVAEIDLALERCRIRPCEDVLESLLEAAPGRGGADRTFGSQCPQNALTRKPPRRGRSATRA
jgi:hypothetical protein